MLILGYNCRYVRILQLGGICCLESDISRGLECRNMEKVPDLDSDSQLHSFRNQQKTQDIVLQQKAFRKQLGHVESFGKNGKCGEEYQFGKWWPVSACCLQPKGCLNYSSTFIAVQFVDRRSRWSIIQSPVQTVLNTRMGSKGFS